MSIIDIHLILVLLLFILILAFIECRNASDDASVVRRPAKSETPLRLRQKMGLYGVGPWNGDLLDYSDDPVAKNQTKTMWDTMATFLDK